MTGHHPLKIWAALAFIYVAWGSSYLATRYGVQTVSPWTFAAVRMSIVAPVMLLAAGAMGQSLPRTARDWIVVIGTGVLMLIGASGTVAWAQQWVPSGEAALIMSASALFTAWLGTCGRSGDAVSRTVSFALVVGLVGIALLIGLGQYRGVAPAWTYLALVFAALAWSGGTILLLRNPVDCGATMIIALQSGIAAIGFGLYATFLDHSPSIWTTRSWLSLGYLVFFGSVAGYGVYYWLLPRIEPALLGTISFVNPAFALLVGHVVAGERLSSGQKAGALLVIVAVVWVGLGLRRRLRRSVPVAFPALKPNPNASGSIPG